MRGLTTAHVNELIIVKLLSELSSVTNHLSISGLSFYITINIISWPRQGWQQKKIYIILFLCLPFIFAAGHFFTPSHHFLGIGQLVSHHDHKFDNKAVLIIDISFSLLAAGCVGHCAGARILL